jgi:hypothetical protein
MNTLHVTVHRSLAAKWDWNIYRNTSRGYKTYKISWYYYALSTIYKLFKTCQHSETTPVFSNRSQITKEIIASFLYKCCSRLPCFQITEDKGRTEGRTFLVLQLHQNRSQCYATVSFLVFQVPNSQKCSNQDRQRFSRSRSPTGSLSHSKIMGQPVKVKKVKLSP